MEVLRRPIAPIFWTALTLGLTSFGGPAAHFARFRATYVRRLGWMSDERFTSLQALCQVLPGPASSQMGFAIGWLRGGWAGALAAFFGFTAPSWILMLLAAIAVVRFGPSVLSWSAGLEAAAVAFLAHAAWQLLRPAASARVAPSVLLAAVSACVSLVWPTPWTIPAVIAGAALLGAAAPALFAKPSPSGTRTFDPPTVSASGTGFTVRAAWTAGALFLLLTAGWFLTAGAAATPSWIEFARRGLQAGAFVFGGGHVVLPLLDASLVRPGWIPPDAFAAGYGAAQLLPGPLFSFGVFAGALAGGWTGAVALGLALFVPGLLLVTAVAPSWEKITASPRFRGASPALQAVMGGYLAAALAGPLPRGLLAHPALFVLAIAVFAGLCSGRLPPLVAAGAALAVGAVLRAAGWLG